MSGWRSLTNLLRRRTASTVFIPQIDGLRFYAVLAVLVFHCGGYLSAPDYNPAASASAQTVVARLAKTGHAGVELFFVISGFVLGLPFARAAAGHGSPVSLRRYFSRRLTRLEPPYIINLLLATAAMVAVGKATLPDLLPHLVASLAYCHNVVFGTGSRINFVAWSLEIEVQFYVLAPLLAGLFALPTAMTRGAVFAVGIGLGSTVAWWLGTASGAPHVLKLTVACFLQYFLVGFALADWYVRGGDHADRRLWADALAIPCALAVPMLEGCPIPRAYLLPLAFGGLCYSGLRGRLHARLLATPALVVVGGMCYTIYLYHPFIISALGPRVVRWPLFGLPVAVHLVAQIAALIGAIVVLCVPLFLCFEKPFMLVGARRHG